MAKHKQQTSKNRVEAYDGSEQRSYFSWLTILFMVPMVFFDPAARDPFLGPRLLGSALVAILGTALIYRANAKLHLYPLKWFWVLLLTFNGIALAGVLYAAVPQEALYVSFKYIFYQGLLLLFLVMFAQRRLPQMNLGGWILSFSLLSSIIGILQIALPAFTFFPGQPQPVGFSGNRNIYGSLISLLLPFSFYYFLTLKDWKKWLALITLGVGIIALLLSQTRSAWLGAGIGFAVGSLILWRKNAMLDGETRQQIRWINGTAVAALIFAVLFVFVISPNQSISRDIKSRLKSLVMPFNQSADIASRNVSERLYVWNNTLDMALEEMPLGVGTGNWRIRFPEYGGATKSDPNLDFSPIRVRPHNFFLRVFSENGIVGILLLLGIIGYLIGIAWKTLQKVSTQQQLLEFCLIVIGLFAFLFDLLFSFSIERIENMLFALLYLSSLLALYQKLQDQPVTKQMTLSGKRLFTLLFPVFLTGLAYGSLRWSYDYHLLNIIKLDAREDNYKIFAEAARGKNALIKLGPVSDPLELQEARTYLRMQEYEKAIEASEEAEQYHPGNHRIYNTRGAAYLRMGKPQEALVHIEKALSLSADYEPSLINQVLIQFELGDSLALQKALDRIDLQQYYEFKQLPERLSERKERQKFRSSQMYRAISQMQQQLDDNKQTINIAPMMDLYKAYASDSLFIADYINTLGKEVIYNALDQKEGDEARARMHRTIGKAKYLLLFNRKNPFLLKLIMENNHRVTIERLYNNKPEDFQTVRDVMAWVNE